MLKKFIQLLIFAGYWLCFTPWIVILLNRHNVINPQEITDYFVQYTTIFFILIIMYWVIHRIFDHCYMKHEVKKRVRKITIKRQLQRLERGEIDINEAQDIRTFTRVDKPKSPKAKRSNSKKPKPREMVVMDANRAKTPPLSPINGRKKPVGVARKMQAPTMPPPSELPPYSDELRLLDERSK